MKIQLFPILFMMTFLNACHSDDKISRLNEEASIIQNDFFPVNPLLEKALTSSINIKDSTMSTLYGNKIAWKHAILYKDGLYPPGAILYEVTWKQKPDSVWFGANIPKEIKSVECITYADKSEPEYQLYEGQPLRKSQIKKDTSRVITISAQRVAVSP